MTSPESRMQEMRAEFERICLTRKAPLDIERDDQDGSTYANISTEFAWDFWQAAWSARTMPVGAVEAIKDGKGALAYFNIDGRFDDAIAALTQLLEQGRD